ncbi:anaerobic ribonucleoside-triphosphate reductase activating protein [Aestuariirhabdus sp. Z084]|nr:anaerobic ribonucleoside-triphosphate reductase activating protein [Aestuariirhabdus haliotis]MCL6420381.1 anaerobic ribonucleoside-triphosphate reductase activating protein [Aestuariirhabdus haliotis]
MSSVDFPGQLSAVLFCQGCNWRCHYCHNPHLIPVEADQANEIVRWETIYAFLKQRQNLLDAVVFSGGEPLVQQNLEAAIDSVRTLGFKVALHTAGSIPERFAQLLPKLDWVGLDIKALPDDCSSITTIDTSGEKSWRSLQLLLDSGVAHEVRTTVHWSLLSPTKVLELGQRLAAAGVTRFALQDCRDEHCLNLDLAESWIDPDDLSPLLDRLKQQFDHFRFR